MSRRRGGRRHIYASVPTSDGRKVAVRSSTIAGRLFGQQQLIEKQAELIRSDTERIKELERELHSAVSVRDHLRDLVNHIVRQRLVRVLVWLRLVSIVVPEKPAPTAEALP